MTIRAKVLGCFLVSITLFGAMSVISYVRARQMTERLTLINNLYLPLSRQVALIQSSVQNLTEDIRRFYFSNNPNTDSRDFSRLLRELYPYMIQKKFSLTEALIQKSASEERKEEIDALTERLSQSKLLFENLIASQDRNVFELNYRKLKEQLIVFNGIVDKGCQKLTQAAQAEGKQSLILNLGFSLILGSLGFLLLLLSNRALTELPILIRNVRRIADGHFDQSIKVNASDKNEISLLAREYNRMLEALSERDKQIAQQQKELLQSERLAAIGQMSAQVVHEIRNPLNSISLNIDWLETELEEGKQDLKNCLRSLSREVARLYQITESYLVRAKIPSQETLKTEINELIREIIQFSKEEDRAKRILVQLELSKDEIYVLSDKSILKQAFLNVIKNAREAMPRGGVLTIRTQIENNTSKVEIMDTGYGMNEKTRMSAFNPFFSTKQDGTGLGLMLTKKVIEEAQGSIECESIFGKGTTFKLQFPV